MGTISKSALSKATKQIDSVTSTNLELKKAVCTLQKWVNRSAAVLLRAVERAQKKPQLHPITNQGIFTVEARKIACTMVDSGCSRGKIGLLLQHIGRIFGISIARTMSCRTVGHAILEGRVVAKMQIQYKTSRNTGVYLEYHSVQTVHQIEASILSPQLCLAGVHSTVDHLSTESVSSWIKHIEDCIDIFNCSPLAQQLNKEHTVQLTLRILKGMHGDHTSTEKGSAKDLQGHKLDAAIKDLREEVLLAKSFSDLVLYLRAWNGKKIAEAEGIKGWEALTKLEKAERNAKLMKEIIMVLGKEAYDVLSPPDHQMLDLFIWSGCTMHKDLNSFKGGNAEMVLGWDQIGATPPIILVKKTNTAILRELLELGSEKYDNLTEAQQRAFKASTCGAIKTCMIAGMIFNNKDNKKRPRG
ncbi:hypothetical protein DFH08DRAFT_686805 [Mycena albidolilacea]|uniref:Uncharacterized protein n=1 Tax=Mycena albidolilacea TaxID=1033008 RepID=A0AAD7AID6_9AGAR|nr:hypothetical protein DFH08DRAFT_686805 [Mycena albidolilacea]